MTVTKDGTNKATITNTYNRISNNIAALTIIKNVKDDTGADLTLEVTK